MPPCSSRHSSRGLAKGVGVQTCGSYPSHLAATAAGNARSTPDKLKLVDLDLIRVGHKGTADQLKQQVAALKDLLSEDTVQFVSEHLAHFDLGQAFLWTLEKRIAGGMPSSAADQLSEAAWLPEDHQEQMLKVGRQHLQGFTWWHHALFTAVRSLAVPPLALAMLAAAAAHAAQICSALNNSVFLVRPGYCHASTSLLLSQHVCVCGCGGSIHNLDGIALWDTVVPLILQGTAALLRGVVLRAADNNAEAAALFVKAVPIILAGLQRDSKIVRLMCASALTTLCAKYDDVRSVQPTWVLYL